MSQQLADILRQAQALSPDEQVQLVARLAQPNQDRRNGNGNALKWSDLRGAAQPSLLGEDAQEWVRRTRAEGDAHRGLE